MTFLALWATLLPGTAAANGCPPDKTAACNTAASLASALMPLWGDQWRGLTFVGAAPRGALLRWTYQSPELMDELTLRKPVNNGPSPLQAEVAKLEEMAFKLCELPPVQKLSQEGGSIGLFLLTLDGFMPASVFRTSCAHSPSTRFADEDDPRFAPLREFRRELQEEGLRWSEKSRLYVYSGETLGCFFSELGTVAAPWGNRREEQRSMWIADPKKKWGARVSVADDGDYQTYFHFENLSDCQQFRIEWAKRREG